MEIPKENSVTTLMEVDIGNSMESFRRYLESQNDLFNSQVDQLEKIVTTQCELTGTNPLAQEMAAGALSINIGKRPRDLLNPKAVKYMQSVFSIKDTLLKKETRDISALCGVTVTQVREFFAGQRSRVRKLVRLSREKAVKSDACDIAQDGCVSSSDLTMPILNPVPLNTMDPDTMDPKTVEESPSCSTQGETIPGIDDFDKNFMNNIFILMRKEGTFSGEVKLMDWILQIQNSSVLYWFVTKGGLIILTAWLSQAALEEQTTVLLLILKVLCHLPLHKALPLQMSAILQTVNRLRFYRTSDISNKAKVLLSRWSKMFVRSQALKKPTPTNFPLSQSAISNELQSNIYIPEEILALALESTDDCRKPESATPLKLLEASPDDSDKKQRGVSSIQTKERRKVMPMEQPDRNSNGRSPQFTRVIPSKQARPMSADDIQKAKMRAIHMQSKYGKTDASPNKDQQQKTEESSKPSISVSKNLLSTMEPPVRSQIEEGKKIAVLASDKFRTPPKVLTEVKPRVSPEKSFLEKLKSNKIPWHSPPEVRLNSLWKAGAGENSKEIEIQSRRMLREKETIYQRLQDIPLNPKEPWDIEMDYDDSLTPEIPVEQPPDTDATEPVLSPRNEPESSSALAPPPNVENIPETFAAASNAAASNAAATTSVPKISVNAPEPDFELLAVLLKNPELVFALTSGAASNISSADMMNLLDMIKQNGASLSGVLNGFKSNVKKEEVVVSLPSPTPTPSLPSPTPPAEHRMNGWRSEVAMNSSSHPVSATNRESRGYPPAPTVQFQELCPATVVVQSQGQPSYFSPPQPTVAPTQQPPFFQSISSGLHQQSNPSFRLQPTLSEQQFQVSQINPTSNQVRPTINQVQQRFTTAALPSKQPEMINFGQMQTVKPAPVTIVLNDRPPVTYPSLGQPQVLLSEPPVQSNSHSMQWNSIGTSRQNQMADSRYHGNHNNYQGNYGGPVQQPLRTPPSWERNQYVVGEPGYETWSPDRSSVRRSRSPEYRSGQNYLGPKRDSGRNFRPDWSQRSSDSSRRNYRQEDRQDSRRWRDRRH